MSDKYLCWSYVEAQSWFMFITIVLVRLSFHYTVEPVEPVNNDQLYNAIDRLFFI